MMIPHHKGALNTAKVAIQHGKDPETKRIAQKSIDDQPEEIADCEVWRKKRGS